jgi:prepilin-type N-terminal cleavage/methylation domain-containing protein
MNPIKIMSLTIKNYTNSISHDLRGFTIIEVLIVLAIGGLNNTNSILIYSNTSKESTK